MKKIRSNGISALETTPVYASQLNEVTEVINKSLGLDADGDGDYIPANVYPVADGEGGFIAGDIKMFTHSRYPHRGYENITIGYLAGAGESLGASSNNIILGTSAGYLLTGDSNVAIGDGTLTSTTITNSSYNVMVGSNAGSGLNNVSYNTFIGTSAGPVSLGQKLDVSESIAIGYGTLTTKNKQAVLGNKSMIETVTRGVHINTRSTTAKNETATLTADECLAGVITSTSAAAVALTLPSAADLIAVLNGGGQGTTFELIIDNSAGANSVTITPSATIAAITSPFTVTNPMIVTTAQKVGCFKFYFTSATSAIVSRIW